MVHRVALGVTFRPVAIWRAGGSLFFAQAQVIVNKLKIKYNIEPKMWFCQS